MRLPLTLAALALVPLALYARVVTFDYVQADDTDLIRGNMSFLQDLRNIPEAFQRSYFDVEGQPSGRKTYYRPLVIVSFMLDAQVGGAEPRVYHLTNVAVHIAAVLLLLALMRALGADHTPSFLSALLFAVHPANAQAIAWIPGRNDTLMAALALVSLIAFLHYYFAVGPHPHGLPRPRLRQGSDEASPKLEERRRVALARRADSSADPGFLRRRTAGPGWLALHVAAYAAALFTKESALALPIVVALLVNALPARARGAGRLGPALLADAIVVAVWFLARRAALVDGGDAPGGQALLAALAANAWDLWLYAGKIVLPAHLSVMPGRTRLDMALGMASLALLIWLLARLAPLWRRVVIGWVLLFLIPALLVPGLPAYEHRLYFPLMGVIVGISQLSVWSSASRRAAVAIVATVAAAFAALSVAHTGVFRDRHTYWSSATTGTPYAGLAYVNLGQIYENDGDIARAADHYRAALAADPVTPGAHNNLGILAARRGDVEEARAEFRREVERHPANADAHFNLGLLDKLSNRMDDAAVWWERAVAADPRHVAAHEELAAYYAAKGDAARAARHLDAARR